MREDQFANAPHDARRWPKSLLAAPILLGLLVFHFTAVGLYVCPPNPVSLASRAWVEPYINPYFSQRWELFAPEPGGTNDSVQVRCHRQVAGALVVTDWIDITAPLVRAHQRNRLGSASRMLRAARPRLAKDQRALRRAVRHLDGELAERATALLDDEATAYFERGKAHLQRLASAECKRRFGSEVELIEARRLSTKVPPYGLADAPPSQRATAIAVPPMPYVEVSL